jgi:hypothetical protein
VLAFDRVLTGGLRNDFERGCCVGFTRAAGRPIRAIHS